MSPSSDYKNLKDLTKSLSNGIKKLESGKLDSNELTSLLEDSRTLHERIAVLQYLAFDKEVKVKEVKKQKKESKKGQGSFELNFGAPSLGDEFEPKTEDLDEDTHANQTNLLDAIEEHIEEFDVEDRNKYVIEKPTLDKSASINDTFASGAPEKTVADKLRQQPIKDLKSAIGLNQKFLFMNDLFEGENEKFNDAVNKINSFNTLTEALAFVDSKLASAWDKENSSVVNFMDLVERRFMV
jgi:predicted transcriptional regulator